MPGKDKKYPGWFWPQSLQMRALICVLGAFLLMQPVWHGVEIDAGAAENGGAATAPVAKADASSDASRPGGPFDPSLRGHGGPVHAIDLNETKTRSEEHTSELQSH